MSIVYPEDDPNLPSELENLRKYLPGETPIIVGGRAAEAYADVLKKIGAVRPKEFKDIYKLPDALRLPAAQSVEALKPLRNEHAV